MRSRCRLPHDENSPPEGVFARARLPQGRAPPPVVALASSSITCILLSVYTIPLGWTGDAIQRPRIHATDASASCGDVRERDRRDDATYVPLLLRALSVEVSLHTWKADAVFSGHYAAHSSVPPPGPKFQRGDASILAPSPGGESL